MDLRRLRAGEWITALAGAVLIASLFLPWYGGGSGDLTGWEALAAGDVLLAAIGAFAVAVLVVTAAEATAAVPLAMDCFATLLGLVASVYVLVRLASLPDLADGRDEGLWLALLGAIGVIAGGALAMRDERLSQPGRPTDPTGRPVPAAPEVEALPAPRP